MGRLENIIARNRRPMGFRATVGFVWRGLFLLFILAALIFTDWALTDEARDPPAPQPPPAPGERRLDGVPVLRSPARGPRAGQGAAPAASASPAAPAASAPPAPSVAPAAPATGSTPPGAPGTPAATPTPTPTPSR